MGHKEVSWLGPSYGLADHPKGVIVQRLWSVVSIKRLQRLYSRLQQQALTITPSVISSSPSIAPSVISSCPSTMVMCFYRKWTIVQTSWTDNNPQRRFWGCSDPYDEPMCARSKAIIPGLLRTINKLRKEVDDIKDQASNHEKEVVLL
ncbi:unnamed protein product [Lactuca saligna]|uniref:Uncharacterized protein n=1 Tax=Lactuca saligna TaxID=75948 RepID=A0AA35V814_LACSI|nr:unnamed protein product [Lactuca saligna]